MANHDDLPPRRTYRVLSYRVYEDTLQRTFGRWLRGDCSEIELRGMLGAFARKWGDNAQTRCITAALNDWERAAS